MKIHFVDDLIYRKYCKNNEIGKFLFENVVADKFFRFAVRVVNLYKFLCAERKEFILSKQLLRSGTAIGALIINFQLYG